jgi:4'-phosphopantetheinyl transferase
VSKGLAGQPTLASGSGRVDVWLTCLCEMCRDRESDCLQFLSKVERAKWNRFVAEDARLQYLVSRALVRTTLSRYAEVSAQDWEFEVNRYGRPHISGPQAKHRIQFNLSNTTGLVVCAVVRDSGVGIDVENTGRVLDVEALAPTVFASEELRDLRSCPASSRRDRFFSYWTLKESYIKARGMGMSIPLDSFWFDFDGPSPRLHLRDRCGDDAYRWQFHQFVPTPEHRLAIAVAAGEGAKPSIRLHWITPMSGRATSNRRCSGPAV